MPNEFLALLSGATPLNEVAHCDFVSRFKIIEVPKGKLLLSTGEICNKLWFIKTGLVRGCFIADCDSGKRSELTDWFAKENDIFHAFESFINQVPSREYIETLESSKLIYITREDLYDLYAKHPEISNLGRIIAERYWLLHKEKLREMRLHSASERLDNFHRQSKDLFLRAPQKYIASYLGISENYVSKLKAKY